MSACGHRHVLANRGSYLGEATRILLDEAGWHFRAARGPVGDIWTESTVGPRSGRAGADSGASAGFFAFFA